MAVQKLIAYHGDPTIKDMYLKRVEAHRKADEIVQHYGYWDNGKGCAVGCTIHGSSHKAYETEIGVPQALARIEDGIFEGLPADRAKLWPEQFLSAIPVGADLSGVWPKFANWLLMDEEHGVIKFAKTEQQRTAIAGVGNAYGQLDGQHDWYQLKKAAYAAAYAAADAAAYAADAAADAASARKSARERQADKLLVLLMAAPILEVAN